MLNRCLVRALAPVLLSVLLAGCGDDAGKKKEPDATPVGTLPDHKATGKQDKSGASTRPGPPAPPPIEPIR